MHLFKKGVLKIMKRYKMISARKFLEILPSLLKDEYKGNYYTPCISERFLKKIRREMRTGYNESLTNIYIFCNGYVLDPREQKNSGIYLKDCDGHFEVVMCRLHNPLFSSEDLLAAAFLNDSMNKEKSDNSSVSKDTEVSDINLLDNFASKALENSNCQTVFQNQASTYYKLYFL